MAYIGNTQQNQNYVPAIDYFSGNGSTTAFTLSRPVASVAQVQAVIENVPQNPGDAYTVSGNTITFTSAPPSGTNNIYVYYTSPNTQVVQPGQGTVGTTQMADGVTVNFNDGSAAAPSITNTGDTNTGMFFPAADTIAFAEGGVESMRIDANGNVGIGTSSPEQLLHAYSTSSTATIFSEGVGVGATVQAISSGAAANLFVGRYDNSPNGPTVVIRKGRGTRASQTAVQTGDNLGGINYQGFCGTTTRTLSQITSWVENYTADDNVSSDLRFITRPTGAGAALTERFRIYSDGSFSAVIPSGSTIYPAFFCRAWVNFNGTGTVAIRASGNVTSITDNATGQYTVNFTNAMPDANYSATGGASSSNCEAVIRFYGYQTGTLTVGIVDSNVPAFTDDSAISVAVFR